jgi:hypothetical protein
MKLSIEEIELLAAAIETVEAEYGINYKYAELHQKLLDHLAETLDQRYSD